MFRRKKIVIDKGPYTVAYSKSDGRYSTVESGSNEKSIAYDGNGNLTFYGAGGAGKHYEYDSENRMVKYYDTTSAGEESADVTLYEYDALGRRISKSAATGGASGSGALYEAYSYAGERVIADYNGDGDIRYRFVYGEGIDEVVCMMKTTVAGQPRYFGYFTDHLGSVVTLYRRNPLLETDPNSVVEQNTYDAYGNVSVDSDGWDYGSQYIFTGRRYDSESGLYYYRARMYNPELGVFQSQDPLGYIDSMNLYAYCANNPLNYVDPWGEKDLSLYTPPGSGTAVDPYIITWDDIMDTISDNIEKANDYSFLSYDTFNFDNNYFYYKHNDSLYCIKGEGSATYSGHDINYMVVGTRAGVGHSPYGFAALIRQGWSVTQHDGRPSTPEEKFFFKLGFVIGDLLQQDKNEIDGIHDE